MAYRGGDLDLRVPHARERSSASEADHNVTPLNGLAAQRALGNPAIGDATLWVDAALLACCNNAYDLALAHGASEVRIEHLVHAMTQVAAAARTLEQIGVEVARLRRDSAMLIVNDNPVSFDAGRGGPYRSIEFESALRQATASARRRGATAGVDDILLALLTSAQGSPVVDLLRRLVPDWQSRNWTALHDQSGNAAPVDAETVSFAAAAASKLDLIEGALRSMHADLAGDRKAVIDIVRELREELAEQRGEGAGLSDALMERLAGLEQQIAARTEPLQAVEKAVHAGIADSVHQLAALEQRLQSIEATVAASTALEPIVDRLTVLEKAVQGRASDAARSWASLADRVQSLEKLYQAGSTETIRQWTALSEGNAAILKSIEQYAHEAPASSETLGQRLDVIEQMVRSGLGDTVRSNAVLADRVEIVERVIGSRNDTETVYLLDERMRSIETALDNRARETGSRWVELVNRLKAIEDRVVAVAGAQMASAAAVQDADALTAPIMAQLTALTGVADNRDAAHGRVLADIRGRLEALEKIIDANTAGLGAAARVYDRNADELHEGFMRLSENQHTLASAINDWREDSTAEFRQIAQGFERLKAMEQRVDALARFFAEAASEPATAAKRDTADAGAHETRASSPSSGRAGRWSLKSDGFRRAGYSAGVRWRHVREKMRTVGNRLRKR